MQQFKEFLIEASKDVEAIKRGLVGFFNDVITSNQGSPITIKIGKKIIRNVVNAKTISLPSIGGIPPYSDIELIQGNNSTIRISVRQRTGKKFDSRSVPALIDGLDSIEKVYPELRKDFLGSLLKYLVHKEGLSHGQIVDQAYGKLTGKKKEEILMGSHRLGGESDYVLAVGRAIFRWKGLKIPNFKVSHDKNTGVVVECGFMDASLYDKTEILAKNEIYVFYKNMAGKTLYLANDQKDNYNNPVVIGPRLITKNINKMKYGGVILVDANVSHAKKVFDINPQDNKYFGLELKSGKELFHVLPKDVADQMNPDDIESVRKRIRATQSNAYQGGVSDSEEYDSDYSGKVVEEKINLVNEIQQNFITGLKRLQRKITREAGDKIEETLAGFLMDEDLNDLIALEKMTPHRLVDRIVSSYYGPEIYATSV